MNQYLRGPVSVFVPCSSALKMSEVSDTGTPETAATGNKPNASDQDETAEKLSLSEHEVGREAGETDSSIVIDTEPIGSESNNNEGTKPTALHPIAIKIEPENNKETNDADQNTPKRKLSDPEAAGDAVVNNDPSPSKRIRTQPNETEADNNEGDKPTELVACVIKREPDDDGCVTNEAIETEPNNNVDSKPVKLEPVDTKVKTEPASVSTSADVSSSSTSDPVKTEPADSQTTPSVVVKTEATLSNVQEQQGATVNGSVVVSSSTSRPSCRFGIRCYRRNPAHRRAEAHPLDDDYRRPDYPAPPLGTPACPFGNSCYRRNPVHFQQHSHPPDFNSAQNVLHRLRRRTNQHGLNDPSSDEFTDEEEDPFSGDSDRDVDYKPGDDIDNDDDEDELEFDSQRVNCDQYD